MTAKVPMWQQAINLHKAHYGEGFAVVVKDEHYYPKLAELLITRRKSKSIGHLDIEPVSTSIMKTNSQPTVVRGRNGNQLMFGDASGAFRIRLSKEDVVHILRCRLSAKLAIEYAVGTKKAMLRLHSLCKIGTDKLRTKLPKKGVWEISPLAMGGRRLHYEKKKASEIREAERFVSHPMYAALERDFLQFFEDLEYYTRYGQSGMRKILLSGPPGTGKTTIAKALSAKHSGQRVFVQADGATFRQVCEDAAKWRVPTVIIAEEVDELYRAGAETLSFLDGMKTPRNPAGTYVIFSTNYPKQIDPRIMKRPGRLDRVLPVGAFRRKAAVACARMFLPADVSISDQQLGAILDRTTPAEIKEMIVIALGICRSAKRELDGEVLALARKQLIGTLKHGLAVCEESMEARDSAYREFGPEADIDSWLEEETA